MFGCGYIENWWQKEEDIESKNPKIYGLGGC
jgi:hypothetical protein